MHRTKEIAYILSLGILFYAIVHFTLSISIENHSEEKIPVFKEARFELSAQPLTLIKELLSLEFFKVKDQSFINQLKQLNSSKKRLNQLDNIHIDFNKAMSVMLLDTPDVPTTLFHFSATDEVKQPVYGKHYIQVGRDVFYAPTHVLNPNQANWILEHVQWTMERIQAKQFVVRQNLGGEQVKGIIKWESNKLSYTTADQKTAPTVMLSPRFFHLSNDFPKVIFESIPKDYKLRNLFSSANHFSINYAGGKLTSDEQFPFAASFEVLIEYDNESSRNLAIERVKSDYDSLKWQENTVQFGTQRIFYTKTGLRTLYFCTDKRTFCPTGQPNVRTYPHAFMCQGDLKRLTNIENTGWAGLVLDMIPAFRASKELFDGTSKIVTTKEGFELTFKPGKDVMHELIHTLFVYGQE
ncbi:MAG: hypothetical protein ACO29U_02590 [Crocinitomicaceae bacterium]